MSRFFPHHFIVTVLFATLSMSCAAESTWYKVEVLVFRQTSQTREQTALNYAPKYPANVTTLHPNSDIANAPIAQSSARPSERKAPRPRAAPTNVQGKTPALDPVLTAQIAAAERAEEAQRLEREMNTSVPLPREWAYVKLKDGSLDLSAPAQRLASRPGYTVERLVGWVQPLDEGATGAPVMIAAQPTGPLGGWVSLYRHGKLEMELNLWYETKGTDEHGTTSATPANVAVANAQPGVASLQNKASLTTDADTGVRRVGLHETVRLTSGATQYVDSPALGALVRVDLVSRPVAQRLGKF